MEKRNEKKNLVETKLFIFEKLVTELSRKKPDQRHVVESCKILGLPTDLAPTDLMQLLLEQYPDFLSGRAHSRGSRGRKRSQDKNSPSINP